MKRIYSALLAAILLSTLALPALAGESRSIISSGANTTLSYCNCRQSYANSRQRPVYQQRQRRSRMGSKTRTALTIAAPAALGAGIGALADGKKGAIGGALIGGSAGALYRLIRTR